MFQVIILEFSLDFFIVRLPLRAGFIIYTKSSPHSKYIICNKCRYKIRLMVLIIPPIGVYYFFSYLTIHVINKVIAHPHPVMRGEAGAFRPA